MIGAVVGNYRVIEKLGEGGMGAVFMAEHQLIGRKAAIKVLHREMSANAAVVQRFFNEARATTLIRHPGLVDIFDFGHLPDGTAYIAMEYLEGESLAARIQRMHQVPLPEIVAIGSQAAAALAAAHAKGIVHRDLKPDNIFLVPDAEAPGGARVKVLDFGIAKLMISDGPNLKTRTGAVLGTPVYMSPEQCKSSGDVDARSDVYSMGCVLFEMACGRPPFVKEGMGEVLGAHIYEEPPRPRSIDPKLPAALDALLMRALVKPPAERTQSMAQLRAELESIGHTWSTGPQAPLQMPAPSAASAAARTIDAVSASRHSTTLGDTASETFLRPEGRRGAMIATAGAVAIASFALAGWYLNRTSPPPPPVAHNPVVSPTARAPSTTVNLTIESDPPGAEVRVAADGALLGRTPLTKSLPRANGVIEVDVHLNGYQDGRLQLNTNTDGAIRVTLSPLPDTTSARKQQSPTAAAPGKPVSNRPAPSKIKAQVNKELELFGD